jgi:DNA-binding Xre family transcriptional regulator
MALAKLGKNENVSMEVLKKVCMALQCDIGDIMELIPENNSPEGN